MDDDSFAEFKKDWGKLCKEMKNDNTLVKEAKQKAKAEKVVKIAAKERERNRVAIKKELEKEARNFIRKNKQREQLVLKINKRKKVAQNSVDIAKRDILDRQIRDIEQNKEFWSKRLLTVDINVQQQGGGAAGSKKKKQQAISDQSSLEELKAFATKHGITTVKMAGPDRTKSAIARDLVAMVCGPMD